MWLLSYMIINRHHHQLSLKGLVILLYIRTLNCIIIFNTKIIKITLLLHTFLIINLNKRVLGTSLLIRIINYVFSIVFTINLCICLILFIKFSKKNFCNFTLYTIHSVINFVHFSTRNFLFDFLILWSPNLLTNTQLIPLVKLVESFQFSIEGTNVLASSNK